MKQQRILTIALLSLSLVACMSAGYRSANTSISVNNYEAHFGSWAYSSDTSIFENSICRPENTTVFVTLEPKELKEIGATAAASGFFELPKRIDPNEHPDGKVTVCGGGTVLKVDIVHMGKSNSVTWNSSCTAAGDRSPPKELAQVVNLLNKTLYQKDTVKELASSKCR